MTTKTDSDWGYTDGRKVKIVDNKRPNAPFTLKDGCAKEPMYSSRSMREDGRRVEVTPDDETLEYMTHGY